MQMDKRATEKYIVVKLNQNCFIKWDWLQTVRPTSPTTNCKAQHRWKKTVKHGGMFLIQWQLHCTKHQIKRLMHNGVYVRIINEVILPRKIQLKRVFQQKIGPKHHSSKLAKKWFRGLRNGIVSWPAQSPNLNPIKHLCCGLKKNLHMLEKKMTSNANDWWILVQDAQKQIPLMRCQTHIKFVPRRETQL